MDGIPMKRVQSAKSLGVYIDERLSWADHIDYLSQRISSAIAGLRQIRPYIPIQTAITIYRSLILPLLDYCDIVWVTYLGHQPKDMITKTTKSCSSGNYLSKGMKSDRMKSIFTSDGIR